MVKDHITMHSASALDSLIHAAIGFFSWQMLVSLKLLNPGKKRVNNLKISIDIAITAFLSLIIDFDHIIHAHSFNLDVRLYHLLFPN